MDNKQSITRFENKGLVFETFEAMFRYAKMVANSHFCPKSLKDSNLDKSAANVMIAMQWGTELGMSPMASIQNIAVVNGVPSIWGDMALGLVRGSGKLEIFEEEYQGEFGTDEFRAICRSKRIGEDKIKIEEFSVADAKKANLWGKSGTWQTHPKRMLRYKARAFNLRDNFTDVLKGIQLKEELEGEIIEVKNTYNKKPSIQQSEIVSNDPSKLDEYRKKVNDLTEKNFQESVISIMDQAREELSSELIEELRSIISDKRDQLLRSAQ